MDIQTVALVRGLLLPFRVYFQPFATFNQALRRGTARDPNPPMLLVYAYSLIWLPLGVLIAAALVGFPTADGAATLLLTMPPLLVALGAFMGIRHVYIDQRWAGLAFDWTAAIAIGLFMNLGLLLNEFIIDDIAQNHHMDIAAVVDSPTLDWPSTVLLGMVLGLTVEVLVATRVGAQKYMKYALPIAAGQTMLMALISRPEHRTMNTLAFGLAGLLGTHLIFQPLWFLLHLATLALLPVNADWRPLLWKISPAQWCEFCYVPLPGLRRLIAALYDHQPRLALDALRRLKQHPFYGSLAERWQQEIVTPNAPVE